MIRIEEYLDEEGVSPFRRWFDDLDRQAAAFVAIAVDRLAEGNTSNVKSVGDGVSELKIDRGPGYRVYFGWDGKVIVVLLGGGTKRRQQADIETAARRWRSFRSRKASSRGD
jgi:putative addiction module killer protein